jgi:WD40 repeat protein
VKLVKFLCSNDMTWQVQVQDTGDALIADMSSDFSFEISSSKKVNDSIAVAADSKTLVARVDDSLSVFELSTGRVLRNLDFGQPTPAVAFAPDGRLFGAYGYTNGKIDAAYGWFDSSLKTLRRVGRRLEYPVNKLALSAKGDRLAVAGRAGFIRVYDTGREREIFRFNARGPIRALAMSPDGRTLACAGSQDGSIRLWDLSSRTPR